MATSESDDFESADEEMQPGASSRITRTQKRRPPIAVDSESDDDAECRGESVDSNHPFVKGSYDKNNQNKRLSNLGDDKMSSTSSQSTVRNVSECKMTSDPEPNTGICSKSVVEETETATKKDRKRSDSKTNTSVDETRTRPSKKPGETRKTIATKKLGTRITKASDSRKEDNTDKICSDKKLEEKDQRPKEKGCEESNKLFGDEDPSEMEMPEELKSDRKFKEVFKPEGWEGLRDDVELPDELTEEKLRPVFNRLAIASDESNGSWSSWGHWGVSSLINTASAGVSTLTNHVAHGINILEETIGMPEPVKSEEVEEQDQESASEKTKSMEEKQVAQSSFGFGNFLSGVSSITKLVETTSSKVMTGGLDTLEAIGKKTMEVLQEGDPGLKKKRAFFTNETGKPILSQILREAKERAEVEEKTLEEKQLARKVHFESLFDDYQGLVHLEALEMLSKQCNIKIQQHLSGLDSNELTSVEETLEEVKELCDLGDEDEDKEEENRDLKSMLEGACNDLKVRVTHDKLFSICEEAKSYVTPPITLTEREIYQHAISILAQFTACSVELFHKTAELLLIKERRSTVNETDSLVQLTHILTIQIRTLATTFFSALNELSKSPERADNVVSNITTIFLEAANASSYIQHAFRLLIPILQVGAI